MRQHHYALFCLVLLIAVIAVGWYRGWFTVNMESFKQDTDQAVQKLKEEVQTLKDELSKLKKDTNKNAPAEAPPK